MLNTLNDPLNSTENLLNTVRLCHSDNPKSGCFFLCLGSSAISDKENISAAGITAEQRRLTPALDAEALVLGHTVSSTRLPASPSGIVSPVVISRAMLSALDLDILVADAGAFTKPQISYIDLGGLPANCLSTGNALPFERTEALFYAGQELATHLTKQYKYIVLAECVPGGTTTALACLTALGYAADNLVSASFPIINHNARKILVQQGIVASGKTIEEFQDNPLLAISCLGDPMQAVIAGMSLAACQHCPVILAGGSQMLAVYALAKWIAKAKKLDFIAANFCIMTTRWVACDPQADTFQLAQLLTAPLIASTLNLSSSKHKVLQAYENGHVKEGVGAGATLVLASLHGMEEAQIIESIDNTYNKMCQINDLTQFNDSKLRFSTFPP